MLTSLANDLVSLHNPCKTTRNSASVVLATKRSLKCPTSCSHNLHGRSILTSTIPTLDNGLISTFGV